ncbi:hypothetical protein G9444_3463 [Rhodococcus erythropolis]|jgi:hypothetical protein|uniref:Uncharacterized protein n=1 Tax=Rhodococcus erythropolis TaxID=1833 RepID=A0A6G9CUN2_RHOER|nr:hypothetical protein G9444_3463 [Rhodococcus erythropolis]
MAEDSTALTASDNATAIKVMGRASRKRWIDETTDHTLDATQLVP